MLTGEKTNKTPQQQKNMQLGQTVDMQRPGKKSWGDGGDKRFEKFLCTGEFRKPHAYPGQDTCSEKN